MSQPVKLSDTLVLDARLAGELQERSIAGQVEFWAKLGRSIEELLEGRQVLALCRSGTAMPLSKAVNCIEKPRGRELLKAHLNSIAYPHYEAHPTRSGLLIRREEDGTETVGRFVNREFLAEGRIAPNRAVEGASRTTRARKSGRARA